MTAYEEALDYIESIPKFTSKNTLEVTRAYLRLLGSPEKGLSVIHVAGTNGKGSVCAYLSRILREAGRRTGLFISPHLTDIRERMSIDGDYIGKDQFLELYELVRHTAGREGLPHPAYFEFLYLMAMVWFGRTRPEYVILETGLGGRLDATNAGEEKILSVITRIGIDHTQYLGNTHEEIAFEKAGILREGVPALCLKEPGEALSVIRDRALSLGAPLTVVGPGDWKGSKVVAEGIDFSFHHRYHGKGTNNADILPTVHALLPTHGLYQVENASLASAAAQLLGIPAEQIEKGLQDTFWPGRMEMVRPGIYLDGGHNPDGIRAFLSSALALQTGPGGRKLLLFSVVADKDYRQMLRMILSEGIFSEIRAVPMPGKRALDADGLRRALKSLEGDVPGAEALVDPGPVEDAFDRIVRIKRDEDLLFVSGSLYLVGMLSSRLKR